MGNGMSHENNKFKYSLEHAVNYTASKLILQQNFKDMQNLADPNYCDNLVILTSEIINKYLSGSDIKYLAQKTGVPSEVYENEKIIAFKKPVDRFDVKNKTVKKRMCIGIAKHYIQIANIFAAIATTLNPIYTYKDSSGNKIETTLANKAKIPKDVDARIKRNNLCSNRLNILMGSEASNKKSEMTINPKFCSINNKNLEEEPGIPELKNLYYDKYDYDTGKFTGMTNEMSKTYQRDVETLYKAFSGNDEIPKDEITGAPLISKFSDIKLKNFYNSEGCVKDLYNKPVTGSVSEYLFEKYADNIIKLISTIKEHHDKLLNILKEELFVYGYLNPEIENELIINPNLSNARLKKITANTRQIIIDLYIYCEKSFVHGLEIYEGIVKKQLLNTYNAQINNLTKERESQQFNPVLNVARSSNHDSGSDNYDSSNDSSNHSSNDSSNDSINDSNNNSNHGNESEDNLEQPKQEQPKQKQLNPEQLKQEQLNPEQLQVENGGGNNGGNFSKKLKRISRHKNQYNKSRNSRKK